MSISDNTRQTATTDDETELVTVQRYRLRLERDETASIPVPGRLNSQTATSALRPLIAEEPRMVFGVLFLNVRGEAIGYSMLNQGTLAHSPVDISSVLASALLANSYAIIAFNNAPSGDPEPTLQTLDIARTLARAGDVLDIPLLDYFIFGEDDRFENLRTRSPRVFEMRNQDVEKIYRAQG